MANDNEYDLVAKLTEILTDNDVEEFQAQTFEDTGLLTMNTGLVITDEDGRTFQLQVLEWS